MREYLLPSVFLSSAASRSLSLPSSLSACVTKMRERLCRLLAVPSNERRDPLCFRIAFSACIVDYVSMSTVAIDSITERSRERFRFRPGRKSICRRFSVVIIALSVTRVLFPRSRVFTYVCVPVAYRSFYLFDRESRYFIVSCSRSFLVTLIQEVYEPYQCRA